MRFSRRCQWFFPLLLVAALPLAAAAAALMKEGEETTLTGLYSARSPSVLTYDRARHMWLSGQPGPGAPLAGGIYYSEETQNGWSPPKPAFSKPGYKIGDPAILRHPSGQAFYMYYTMTPLPDPKQKPKPSYSMPRKSIGFAVGTPCSQAADGSGVCWRDMSAKAPFIGDNNGYNKDGAGEPSAVISGNQIWLYYKTNPPSSVLMRTRLDLTGTRFLATEPVTIQRYDILRKRWDTMEPQEQILFSGTDVAKIGKSYVMVSNVGSNTSITRLESDNGLNFHYMAQDNNGAFLSGGKNKLLSPHIVPLNDKEFLVYAAKATPDAPCARSLYNPGGGYGCAGTIKAWKMRIADSGK